MTVTGLPLRTDSAVRLARTPKAVILTQPVVLSPVRLGTSMARRNSVPGVPSRVVKVRVVAEAAGDELPVWDEQTATYLDAATGEVLPSWDDALDAIGDQDEPLHVARFGAQGVLAWSKDAARCIGYLTKYLNKQVSDCHQAATDTKRAHVERLADALRFEPCSQRCADWLRYGVQPKNPRPGLYPGACRGKAHRREHLGYAGRRVLVSRKWSGKTLADHRADRKNWLLATLGKTATDPARYSWLPVAPGDPDYMEQARRLLHVVADRQHWQAALADARRKAIPPQGTDVPSSGRAA